jgi:hypothetical protein
MKPATDAEIEQVTLLDLLDRIIDHGVVLTGDITISVADVDLIYLGLRVILSSVERAQILGLQPPDGHDDSSP